MDKVPRVKPSAVELRGGETQGGVTFKAGLSSPPPTDMGVDEPDSNSQSAREELAARQELGELRKRVAELEMRLGERKRPQGLDFFVSDCLCLSSHVTYPCMVYINGVSFNVHTMYTFGKHEVYVLCVMLKLCCYL